MAIQCGLCGAVFTEAHIFDEDDVAELCMDGDNIGSPSDFEDAYAMVGEEVCPQCKASSSVFEAALDFEGHCQGCGHVYTPEDDDEQAGTCPQCGSEDVVFEEVE